MMLDGHERDVFPFSSKYLRKIDFKENRQHPPKSFEMPLYKGGSERWMLAKHPTNTLLTPT
jgi:hypothetical protein